MISGDDATTMLRAQLAGDDFPPDGVDDTDETRKFWGDLAQSCEDMPGGTIPDVPHDWATVPGPEDGDGDG